MASKAESNVLSNESLYFNCFSALFQAAVDVGGRQCDVRDSTLFQSLMMLLHRDIPRQIRLFSSVMTASEFVEMLYEE
jgi:hypothetical protein